MREAVGINEVQNFGKYRVEGSGARAWLDRIMAGRVPKPGRLSLTPMLSTKGKLIGDFTITCLAEDECQLTASYAAQAFHERWFRQHPGEDNRWRISPTAEQASRSRDLAPLGSLPMPVAGIPPWLSWM